VVPKGASLSAVAGEVRLRWETLSRLLEEHAERGTSQKVPAPGGVAPQNRLRELEARAQWLEEELATAREQFRVEASRAAESERSDLSQDSSGQPE
jgi:hypothetical protein